jgi:hypothetical protein
MTLELAVVLLTIVTTVIAYVLVRINRRRRD